MKKLIPALCLLLISAILMGTSTYAWFSMNAEVKATGMMVKAKAEAGLLISEVSATTGQWDDEATGGTTTTPYALIPMSTSDGAEWFHANSKLTSDAAAASSTANSANIVTGYTKPTLVDDSQSAQSGVNSAIDFYYINIANDGYQDTIDQGAYVKYTFYLKSSGSEITCKHDAAGDQYVEITSIDIDGLSGSKTLDAALRVGVKIKDTFYIYAPISDSTNTYYVGTSHATVATQTLASGSSELNADGTAVYNTISDLDKLPAFTATGHPVEIYLWIEGEDANCTSNNITTSLDNLSVSVNFSLITKTA